MLVDVLLAALRRLADQPLLCGLGVVAATPVLEDAATVAVALLALQMVIAPGAAVRSSHG